MAIPTDRESSSTALVRVQFQSRCSESGRTREQNITFGVGEDCGRVSGKCVAGYRYGISDGKYADEFMRRPVGVILLEYPLYSVSSLPHSFAIGVAGIGVASV